MLKFYAKSNLLVRIPGAQPRPGQPDMYVGRVFDKPNRAYPASKTGYEVDEESDQGRRLLRLVRIDKCLWPANLETASLCGVDYVPVEFDNGAFVEKKEPKKKPQTSTEG